ncbi:MAG: F0F1 ATP synthase subunit B [Candidatus Pacebacteria bacterium]|nr:F0F1 ATP synthase subunit B [Candidatus Paceibacterota bacterium]
MAELFQAFGIDWKILVINLVNFGGLVLVLWYFLYGPVVRMLEARRQNIAEGVAAAEKSKQELGEIEGARAGMLAKAGKEADDVLSSARAAGTEKQREIMNTAEAAAHRVLTEAQAQAKEMKDTAMAESKQEVAKLIVLGIEKTLKEKRS